MVSEPTDTSRVWFEWASANSGTSTIEYALWDTRHNRKVFENSIVFKPFTSIVVVLLGETRTPSDPATGFVPGIINFGIDEYRAGRDVYMYDEDDVDPVTALGPAFNDIVDAVNNRDVGNVALIGYSHGGGKLYTLSTLLAITNLISKPFSVPFTAYVDAVEADYETDNTPEPRRPILSAFHLNQYETTGIPAHGIAGNAPLPGSESDYTPFGFGHLAIANSSTVMYVMRLKLREKVAP